MKTLRYLALVGNILFFLWIVWNGIDEGSRQVGRLELFSLGSLLCLLALNFFLLWRQK
ncbi:MAG: hypothetical protein PHV42_02625 [Candidatus Pacebacteria bacterium]|nr:hypothetical protein [Candidatus Paceibacterota bacterium]